MRVLLLLILPLFCKSQTNDDFDSLKKYTYRLTGHYKMSIPGTNYKAIFSVTGSCFFIKRNKELFLITASHLITGCDDDGKPKEYADTINVCMNTSCKELIPVDISKIRDTAKCVNPDSCADAIAIRIDWKYSDSLYTVENLLTIPYDHIGDWLVTGFPSTSIKSPFILSEVNPSYFLLENGKYAKIVYPSASDPGKIGTSNNFFYWLDSQKSKIDSSLKGYSGSPVFVKNRQTGRWRIAGIFSAAKPPPDLYVLGVAKIESATESIDYYFKTHETK